MDRYIVREPRLNTDHYEGNAPRMIAMTSRGLHLIDPDEPYYQGQEKREEEYVQRSAYLAPVNVGAFSNQLHQGHMHKANSRNISGIDQNYLAAFSPNFSNMAPGQIPMQREVSEFEMNIPFGMEYQNKNFLGPEKNFKPSFVPQPTGRVTAQCTKPLSGFGQDSQSSKQQHVVIPKPSNSQTQAIAPRKKESDFHKVETTTEIMSRSEKLKMLLKTGPRAFTGPVEKVLKWHKSLQDLGILVIYEIIGKCVSIRAGESCAKNLVVRDDNGPAMQVVYHEIDFLLPELKPPCMLRVIGRMLAGTCRLQAFNIRPATGDDIAILPRRAAVASHHVSKLFKEFSTDCNK